jgi:hypothetical protein
MNKDKLIGLVWAIVVCAIISLCSCATTRYVSVPEYHFRDSTKLVHVRDSVFNRDSVFMYVRGDTVYHEHYNTIYKEHYYSDTINNVYRDSIYKYRTRSVEVKTVHKLHWWQKSLMWIGVAFLFSSIIWLVFKVRRL